MGGKLYPDERWYQLCNIKKARESSGRIMIMPKDEMRKLGILSPDAAEALMLTFIHPLRIFSPSYENKFFDLKMKQKKFGQGGLKNEGASNHSHRPLI